MNPNTKKPQKPLKTAKKPRKPSPPNLWGDLDSDIVSYTHSIVQYAMYVQRSHRDHNLSIAQCRVMLETEVELLLNCLMHRTLTLMQSTTSEILSNTIDSLRLYTNADYYTKRRQSLKAKGQWKQIRKPKTK